MAFGAGWVTAEDRGAILQLLRGPARIAALDVPGLDPFEVAFSGRNFVPSAGGRGVPLEPGRRAPLPRARRDGSILAIIRAYAAGVNGWNRLNSVPAATLHDERRHRPERRSSRRASARTGAVRCERDVPRRARASGSARTTRAVSSRTCAQRTTPKRRSPSSRRSRTTFRRERRRGASSWTTAASRAHCRLSHRLRPTRS